MPRVLYEASYIGNPKSFSFFIEDIIESIMILILVIVAIYTLKKESGVKEEYCGYALKHFSLTVFALFGGVFGLLYLVSTILNYNEEILEYKRGKYSEVEGFVEDYTDSKTHTFTVNGVEFEVSAFVQTWGYTYAKSDNNVITGDGQHLKIRYMPHSSGSNTIVYIEEIGPPLTRPDVKQEEEIEEPAIPIDQIGVQGRTEEETELIQKILSQDKKEFQRFLMTDRRYLYKYMIWISAYDFTGDGIDEILVSKYYKDMSAELTYNYVHDQTGRRVLEFVGGGDTQIIDGWDGDGTFLLYDNNDYFSAPSLLYKYIYRDQM